MKPLFAVALAASTLTAPLGAQGALRSAPSTRATVEVTLAPPRVEGQPAPKASMIRIEYGQPHARGRAVEGALKADLDTVWRLGANNATTLTTDVDLVIGGADVPRGAYFLYAQTSSTGPWKLIINRNTGQTGASHVPAEDLARVPLAVKTLPMPVESLSITLVPAGDGSPRGDLRVVWGNREFTTTWAAK